MKYVFILSLLSPLFTQAQTGTVNGAVECNGEGIPFANVSVSGTSLGTACDVDGKFNIKEVPVGKQTIQVSAIGYKTYKQTLEIKKNNTSSITISTEETAELLNEVVVTGTLNEVSIMESAVPIEVYTPEYFKKNPTPSLFQALQIVNGVRPQINCSVCNTGDVHINGMEGPYTMITIDGMPIVGGLASVYGLNGIPNSMIERMEVVKGPASTLFGSEAVGGLINVITKSPENAPRFSFDVMSTTWQEVNTDLAARFNIGKATSILGLNYFNYSNPIDKNGDNFTDLTLSDRVSIFNKWSFKRKDFRQASLGFRYIYEDRWGGEMQFNDEYRGGDSIYGESIYTSRYEIMGKYQMPFKENLFFSFSYSNHDQNSTYGTTSYIADQNITYGQLHWDKTIWKIHDVMAGLAYRHTFYDDNTPATYSSDTSNPYNNPERVQLPGVFLQDDIGLNEKNKLLLGIRYDYNNAHGNIFTPRVNYKWAPNEENTIRLSLGTGYRVVNLFTEDHAAVTGSRDVIIAEELQAEQSKNINLHYQKFSSKKFGFINFNMSLFYTHFSNKISPDYETNSQQIIYANLDGYAVSQGGSFNLSVNFVSPLKVKIGGTFLDVYQISVDESGERTKDEQLLTERYSGTFSLGYNFQKLKMKIDYSGNLYGPMKLPLVENDFRPEYSDWYSIQNIKVSKTFGKAWEIYGGVKNLLNFTPPSYSILRANDPFDENVDSPDNPNGYTFDPTYVYAANQGIHGFFGVRYTLE